ncbi:M48 family metallopeptidase [Bifidobacterium sp. 64T4]|uniref:M48 family metallopeptidase n=1 Tax=Bifidobacterium pongonis TaxID=2834432 RepID=UPI001C57A29E|nr:SprT family zinc-dependent metalloprotease [Bifidobacterium pongonis]MBW3094836.1 M48 family metallopeptidase [Bifidobacterium pongonis]
MAHNDSVRIDGLDVQVTRKPIKNMYLRIKPPTGVVAVSAPRRTPDATIIAFVRSRRVWIDENRNAMRQRAREEAQALGGGRFGMGGGDTVGMGGMTGANGENSANGASDAPATPATPAWNDDLRRKAAASINAALPALLARWEPIVGKSPTHITLRTMTSRWGSCTPRTGRIRLNLQLGLMDPKFLEYVLVHELTHLWEHGHGEGFRRRMDAYLPDWRRLRRELNRHIVLQ